MSLDTTAHRASASADELVPSRYALKVGDIDVLVISDGVLPITAVTMATNAAPADLSAWLKDMYLPPEVLDWPLNVAVIRSGGKTILVDSGLGTEFPDFPRAGQLAVRLVAAGIDPASVTDVVLTHLHMDHIGGLLVDGLRNQLRPDLRVHLASAEAEFWEAPDFTRTVMPAPIPDVLRRTAAQFLDLYRGRLHPFDRHQRDHEGTDRPDALADRDEACLVGAEFGGVRAGGAGGEFAPAAALVVAS